LFLEEVGRFSFFGVPRSRGILPVHRPRDCFVPVSFFYCAPDISKPHHPTVGDLKSTAEAKSHQMKIDPSKNKKPATYFILSQHEKKKEKP
jgi:hypothetical protein